MNTVIVILAAGAASRFSGIKQIASLNNQPLINFQLDKLSQLRLPIYLVLGCYAGKIIPVIKHQNNLKLILNEHWQRGMGSSIACAIQAIEQTRPANQSVLIQPLDQVHISLQEYQTLLRLHARATEQITASFYQNTLGCPAIFPRTYYTKLSRLNGSKGASSIIKQAQNINRLWLPNAAYDIDTPAQLASLNQLYSE